MQAVSLSENTLYQMIQDAPEDHIQSVATAILDKVIPHISTNFSILTRCGQSEEALTIGLTEEADRLQEMLPAYTSSVKTHLIRYLKKNAYELPNFLLEFGVSLTVIDYQLQGIFARAKRETNLRSNILCIPNKFSFKLRLDKEKTTEKKWMYNLELNLNSIIEKVSFAILMKDQPLQDTPPSKKPRKSAAS